MDRQPTDAECLAWIRLKLNLPLDTPMFSGKGQTIAGAMHVMESHAHGYETYIEAFKCDDKQGEIARLTVELAEKKALVESLAERVAAQSQLLAKRAEKIGQASREGGCL